MLIGKSNVLHCKGSVLASWYQQVVSGPKPFSNDQQLASSGMFGLPLLELNQLIRLIFLFVLP